jgi:hypothetical protein
MHAQTLGHANLRTRRARGPMETLQELVRTAAKAPLARSDAGAPDERSTGRPGDAAAEHQPRSWHRCTGNFRDPVGNAGLEPATFSV